MAFPTVVRRATAVSATSNATSWSAPSFTWNTNTAILAGETVLWVLIVSSDGNPTLTETGGQSWTKKDQASDATLAVTQAIFTLETTGAFATSVQPAITISSTASEQYSAVLLAFKMDSGQSTGLIFSVGGNAQGSSTNSDPPVQSNLTGASRDLIFVVTRSGDSTVVATVAPTNYSNLQSRAGGGTAGASTNTAERNLTLADGFGENPGTFTSATEQWVSWTLAVYQFTNAQALIPALFSNSTTFPAATVGRGAVALTPPLVGSAVAFFAPTIGAATQALTPGLLTNSTSFAVPTVASTYPITPGLKTSSISFAAPTVTPGAVALLPSLVTNSQSFAAATVATTYGIALALASNAQTFPAAVVAAGAVNVAPARLVEVTTFGVPTIQPGTVGLLPSLVTNILTFPAATVSSVAALTASLLASTAIVRAPNVLALYGLTPALLTNSTTVPAATVAAGAANIAPALTVNAQSFFGSAVAAGAVNASPSLFVEANSFAAATVQPGAIALVPGILTSAPTFGALAVSSTAPLIASLFGSSAVVRAPSLLGLYGLASGLFTNSGSFAAAVVASGVANIAPPPVPSAASFPSATITGGAVALQPPLLAANDTFPSATVSPGLVALIAPLLSNISAIYAPAAQSIADIRPSLIGSTLAFYAASLEVGSPQTVIGALFANTQTFGAPVVDSTTGLLTGLVTSQAVVFGPEVANQETFLVAELFANESLILGPVVQRLVFGGRHRLPHEDRSLQLPAEDRSMLTPAENRHYILPREVRTETLPAENRRVVVPRAA